MSKTVTITHNSDGSKSISLSATVGVNVSLSSGYVGNVTASGTATLTAIPRNSAITSAANVTLGNNVSITWTPATTSYGYRIHLTIVGDKGQWDYGIGSGDNNAIHPNTTNSYTYTNYQLPVGEIAALVTNSKTATCKATLYTYTSSNVQVGSGSSKNFTVTIPTSTSPTVSSFTASMVNTNSTVADWGVYVKGYSSVKMDCSASGMYGATISSYKYVYGSASNSSTSASYTGKLTSSGSVKVYCIVTDSRGYTATSETITLSNVYTYSNPTLDSFIADRNKSNSECLDVYAAYTYSSIAGNNAVTTTLQYKKTTSSSWITYSDNIPNKTSVTINDVVFEESGAYDIRICVKDSLGNTSSYRTASITTREVLMDFYQGGKGLGIGKMCEGDGLDINMDIKFRRNIMFQTAGDTEGNNKEFKLLLDFFYPIGKIFETTDGNFNPASVWGGTWKRITDKFLLAAGDAYAAGSTGGESEHALTASENGPHTHVEYLVNNAGTNVWTPPVGSYVLSNTACTYQSRSSVTESYTGWFTQISQSSSGNGTPHNNMPPYVAVYIWERIA